MSIEDAGAYEVEIRRNVFIPIAGGELAADLYLPKGASRSPALIMLVPYSKDWGSGSWFWHSHHYFARHGYACVLVDFRGTGSSSGEARAPFDPAEADDGVAAIEWAAQQAWCTGQVGMWGASYGAISSLRVASRRPPSLKAIIPIVGTADIERDFVHPYGTPGCLGPLDWGLFMLALQLTPPMHRDAEGRWRTVWEERLGTQPHVMSLLGHKAGAAPWRASAIDAGRIEVPSFCIAGWRDLFAEGMIRAYEQIGAPKKLLAGPWMHTLPQDSPFDPTAVLPLMRRWWDRWLRGIQNGIDTEAPVTVYVQGRAQWLSFPSWGDLGAEPTRWFAGAEGTLHSERAHAHAGVIGKAPDATIGVGSALASYQSAGFGLPVDQRDDDGRGLSFTSAALPAALPILGRARLRLKVVTAEPGAAEATVVAKLTDVHPDGRSVFITTGAARLSGRDGDAGLTLDLAPTCYEIPAGHRLRLMLANGDFTRLWPNANPPELRVQCGGAESTELHVPLMPAGAGHAVHLESSTPQAPPHLLAAEPLDYEVRRDERLDSVTVKLRSRMRTRSMDFANTLDFTTSVQASVAATHPEAARFSGTISIEITSADRPMSIVAQLDATQEVATAKGEIVVGEHTVFTRQWTVSR